MSEWLTYSLSDFLLFSPRTYYRLFELYNLAIWPAQIIALALGIAILFLLRGGADRGSRAIAATLAAAWLWVAWAYLLQRYDTINWAARYFAAGFALEGLLLLGLGVIGGWLRIRPATDAAGRFGLGLFVFALVAQPLIGPFVGREWTEVEIFGLAPDPTAVGTMGLVLAVTGRAFAALLAIPLIWCAISGATLWTMESPDAMVMPLAAAIVLCLAVWKAVARPKVVG